MSNATFAARLWAALEELPMPGIAHRDRRRITCAACGQTRPHEAKGLCATCYDRGRKSKTPVRSGPRNTPTRGLLPIPPMVRCSGAPGLRCDRVARADVGVCFRCAQERARAGVAA